MDNILYLVVPCYNEEEVLPMTAARLGEKVQTLIHQGVISDSSRILFVNDGSKDATWRLIRQFHEEDPHFCGLSFGSNRGHQNALLAGLMYAREHADVAISLDADLQDDIDAIDQMLSKHFSSGGGYDIVYGVRNSRESDTLFKRCTAQAFYRIMKWLGTDTVYNHADFRLMSRKALDALAQFQEVNLFLRGIVPMIGYSSTVVYYERHERLAGKSKYPFRKMLSFAVEGITSFSIRPIRLISALGALIFAAGVVMLIYSLFRHLAGHTVSGWTSLIFSIWALGGLVLLSLGVIGEYIGKIYMETKRRPRYLVDEILDD